MVKDIIEYKGYYFYRISQVMFWKTTAMLNNILQYF